MFEAVIKHATIDFVTQQEYVGILDQAGDQFLDFASRNDTAGRVGGCVQYYKPGGRRDSFQNCLRIE